MLVGSSESFVVLAPGGSGKTVAMNRWCEQEPSSSVVDVVGLSPRELREELGTAVEAGGPVFLDGVDVAVRDMPQFFDVLRKMLDSAAAKRTAWRFACRPGVWSPMASVQEYRLLPLDRAAARATVADRVADPDAFLEAVVTARLGRLAACPLQLRDTATQWQETGELPTDQIASMRYEVGRLLREHKSAYRVRLAADRQLRLAGRLAAFNVFSGVAAFAREPIHAGSAMPVVAELPSDPEPDAPGQHVNLADLEDVLGSALFESGSTASLVFRHQRYAEYLAAGYLVTRGVTSSQVSGLLGVRDGVIPGPQIGVAVWLTALQPELTSQLLARNSLAIARSGIDLPEPARAALTEALLDEAARGQSDIDWAIDPKYLVHSQLEPQLHRFADSASDATLIWWLGTLARAGRCTGLADDMLRLSLDTSVPPHSRRATIAAVAEVGTEQDLSALTPLLHLQEEDDPDDEVLAGAITALHPQLLTTADLISVLRPRRNTHFIGAYLQLFADLAVSLPTAELPMMLEWLARQGNHDASDDDYGWFPEKLTDRAWHHLHIAEVMDGLAALLVAQVGPPHFGHAMSVNRLPWNALDIEDANRRRQLAVTLAQRIQPDQWDEILHLGLLVTPDADWILDTLPDLPATAQRPLADCLSLLLPEPTATQADCILSLPPSHPAYESTKNWREPIDLDSDYAKRMRKSHQRRREAQKAHDDSGERQIAHLAEAIRDTDGDADQWWRITYWLGAGDRQVEIFSHDLTSRSGWQHLDPAQRDWVIDTGIAYLERHELRPEKWFGHQQISDPHVVPDWAGVYLMTTLTRHTPQRLAELSPQAWQRWAPAIIAAWNFDRNTDAELRSELLDHVPADSIHAISEAALGYLDAINLHGGDVAARPVVHRILSNISDEVADRIGQERYGPHLTQSLLNHLIEFDAALATTVSRLLTTTSSPDLASTGQSALCQLVPSEVVNELIRGRPSLDQVTGVVPRLRLDLLEERELETLADLLLVRFPLDDDPPLEGVGFVSPEMEVREVRRRVLTQLQERGSTAALERLREGRPPTTTAALTYYARTARLQAAETSYTPVRPEELLNLLKRSDTRLVKNDYDLMCVVLEHFAELQRQIRSGAHHYLWNEHTPKTEDTISDWVRHELQSRLRHGVVDREVQVARPTERGIGTRIDLTATSATATHPIGSARLIIEAKLINNKGLLTALTDQLAERYLKPTGRACGVYLVYWIDPEQRRTWPRKGPTNLAELTQELHRQATALNAEYNIEPIVLDISRPPA